MILRNLFVALVGCALFVTPLAITAQRGPSTPEERKQALEYIQHFEADPLNANLKPEIQWLTEWTIEIPDVHVNLCTILDFPKKDKKDSQTLFTAMFFAQVKFALEHPEAQTDHIAEYQAGVEGALRIYESLLKTRPKDQQTYFDDLIHRRDTGVLSQWVKERADAICHK
ncbi:MAG: hypothetical protein WB424_15300 [Terracidiphilus sp.]